MFETVLRTGQKLNLKVAQNFRTEPEVEAQKDKDLMGHKSNDVGEDEEGDKSIPLLPLRVQTELVDCPTQLNLCFFIFICP